MGKLYRWRSPSDKMGDILPRTRMIALSIACLFVGLVVGLILVEADETFIGGKAKNMHASVRARRIHGRGGMDKTPVVGVKDRPSGKVTARPTTDTTCTATSTSTPSATTTAAATSPNAWPTQPKP